MIHYRAGFMLLGSIKDVLYGILTLNNIDLNHGFVQSPVPSIKKNASQEFGYWAGAIMDCFPYFKILFDETHLKTCSYIHEISILKITLLWHD